MSASDLRLLKKAIREKIWATLEKEKLATFPLPVWGRIPNFIGSEKAAAGLCVSPAFRKAEVVKVNPDAPQREVRRRSLFAGKKLVMPTPRLSGGFLVVDPRLIPSTQISAASSIAGAFKWGKQTHPSQLPEIDLIVLGSVAVTPDGRRLGKGEGYGEIEYGLLREHGRVGSTTPIYTTVHPVQIVEYIPHEEYDLAVDAIFTPEQAIWIDRPLKRPDGIIWRLLPKHKIQEIPLLRELTVPRGGGKAGS